MPSLDPSDDAGPESRHARLVEEGLALYKLGNLAGATRLFRTVLRENPGHADALHLLGLTLKQRGDLPHAEKLVRAAIQASGGGVATFHNTLGNLLREQRQFEQAGAVYETALRLDAHNSKTWMNFARLEGEASGDVGVVAVLGRAADQCPDDAEISAELGLRLFRLRRMPEALRALQRHAELAPETAAAWLNLGLAYDELKQVGRAMTALLKALQCDPNHEVAKLALAQMMNEAAAPQEAEALLLAGIQDGSIGVEAYANLGNIYKGLGYLDLALDCYAKALAARPSAADHANFLYMLLYDPTQDDQEVAEEHRLWAKEYAEPLRPAHLRFDNAPDPDRPLRIGYVSGHFWDHAVAMFSLPMIQAHDRQSFELYLYSSGVEKDGLTTAFQNCAKHWRDISTLDDDAAAGLVREDQIDILIDLAGHIGGNRLMLFARKAAPIQVTYLGYQATTGMEVMDYRLTDAIADPPGVTDKYYVEKLARLTQFRCV